MLNFKQYHTLAEEFDMNKMDLEFLKRAEKVTAFNIQASDFTSNKYKSEIQHLFNKHFFPKFDISSALSIVDMPKLNKLISQLKREDASAFKTLHSYPLKGVGPGEATMFFLLSDGHLGGGSSRGVDLVVGSKKYEIKAVNLSANGKTMNNFKIGGTVDLSKIISSAVALKKQAVPNYSNADTEINTKQIQLIEQMFPKEWKAIKQEYQNKAYSYFKGHEVIFINNSPAKLGEIISIKKVKKSDIELERITSGTVKPMVKV